MLSLGLGSGVGYDLVLAEWSRVESRQPRWNVCGCVQIGRGENTAGCETLEAPKISDPVCTITLKKII